MSMVLYSYVYITARASFLAQSVCVLEVSRTLGRSAAATFREVALPLARPVLAAGVALALMKTINDIGAVEFLGVRTLIVASTTPGSTATVWPAPRNSPASCSLSCSRCS